jgi:hypothetical protein
MQALFRPIRSYRKEKVKEMEYTKQQHAIRKARIEELLQVLLLIAERAGLKVDGGLITSTDSASGCRLELILTSSGGVSVVQLGVKELSYSPDRIIIHSSPDSVEVCDSALFDDQCNRISGRISCWYNFDYIEEVEDEIALIQRLMKRLKDSKTWMLSDSSIAKLVSA